MTLIDDLRRHEPADALEGQHLAETLDLLTRSARPFARDQFDPGHVTASCFIVNERKGALLLHHHQRLDRWLQMGGHVEGEESTADAALREGAEESGLRDLRLIVDSIFDVDVHSIPAARGEPAHRHFDVRYLARTSTPSSIAIDRTESNDLAWVPLDRAESLMGEEASLRVIRKIRSCP